MPRPSSLLVRFGPLSVLALAACGAPEPGDSVAIDSASPPSFAPTSAPVATDAFVGPREATALPPDADGDGVTATTDCDDTDATVYPGATEADDLADDDCDGWVDEDFVAVGDIIFTEINRQALLGGTAVNNDGSWVEVYNTSDRTVDLANWVLSRGAAAPYNQVTLDPAEAPVLAPGEYAVFCDTDDYEASATAAWPLTCDYVWGDETQPSTYNGTYHSNTFYIRRDSDLVALYVAGSRTTGTRIDAAQWFYDATNGYWPRDSRFSMSLDPRYYDGDDNDLITTWCSTTTISTGGRSSDTAWRWYDVTTSTRDEFGSPGADNYDCPNDPDLDGDGYTGTDDCDDHDTAINPGATESCDGVDEDCDGLVDDGTAGSDWYPDADADSYGDAAGLVTACQQPADDYVTDATDCDDTSADAFPGGTEVCDGLDNDCNGSVDDGGLSGDNTFYADADADGFGDPDTSTNDCLVPSGYVSDASDCDDTDATVNPDGTEDDDLADDDCDGWVDEDFVAVGDVIVTEVNRQSRFGGTVVVNDGSWVEVYNTSSRTVDLSNWVIARGTSAPYNQVTLDPAQAPVLAPGDFAVFCDTETYEASAAAYPLTCDYVWGDPTQSASYVGTYHDNTFYIRRETDTFGLYVGGSRTTGTRIDAVSWTYSATDGYWPRDARFSMSLDNAYFDGDLNDNRTAWCSTTSSAAGTPSNNTTWRWYDTTTTANDEHGTPGAVNYDCLNDPDLDGDGYTGATDCDEGDPAVNPGATEVCNDIDDDCDDSVDEDASDALLWYADADGDGYGDPLVVDAECDQPDAYVADDSDCDDTDATITIGDTWYPDVDGDTYGDMDAGVIACDQPTDYLADGTDCDDADNLINPGITEQCDGVDEDCDGTIDDGAPGSTTFYADADDDGYGDPAVTNAQCIAEAGFVADNTDCDDTEALANPGQTEVCDDYIDNDCDPDPTVCEWSGTDTVKADYDFRAYGNAAGWSVGHAVANNGDFDGDGYDDVIVGQAYHDEGALLDAGRTFVWYGPVDTDDTVTTYDVAIVGAAANDQFGYAARFAGDVDGDGLDDLLAGAWRAESNDRGRAYLFLGGTTPSSVSSAYATFAPTETNNFAGMVVDGADYTGDGLSDVLVTAYGRSVSAGAVAVWSATAIGGGAESFISDSTVRFTGAAAGDTLGYSAAFTEDLDGDGMADLLLGAPALNSTTTPGKVYVVYGANSLTGTIAAATAGDAILSGTANGDRFGLSVASVGDVDGDGNADFAVAADKEDTAGTDAGAIYVFTSAPSGSSAGASSASSIITGELAGDFFGRSLAGVNDTNGDGYDDVYVGATGFDSGALSLAGATYMFYGPLTAGTTSAAAYDLRLTGANSADAVGYAVGGGGDVDDDGYADFMTSAPSWDGFGYGNSGGSWLYYGRGE